MKNQLDLDPDLYNAWRASELGRITESLEDQLLYDIMGQVRDKDVLDVGCGDGTSAIVLSRRGARVFGIDLSADMIKAAREQARIAGSDARFLEASADRLPFESAHFDIVLAKTILCFVENPTETFAELTRVLRPGGRLVIGELGKSSTWAATRRIRAWLGSKLWRKGRFRSAAEIRRLSEEAGLNVTVVRGAIYYPRLLIAARIMRKIDPIIGRVTTFGAAFLGLCAIKPMTE